MHIDIMFSLCALNGCDVLMLISQLLSCQVDTERISCAALHDAILETSGFSIPHSFPGDFTEEFGMDVRSCLQHYMAKFPSHPWSDLNELAEETLKVHA